MMDGEGVTQGPVGALRKGMAIPLTHLRTAPPKPDR